MHGAFSEHFEVRREPRSDGPGYSHLVLLAVFFPMVWCCWDSAGQGSGCAHALRTLVVALLLGHLLQGSYASPPRSSGS